MEAIGKSPGTTAEGAEVFRYPAHPGPAPLPEWNGWIEAPGGETGPTGAKRIAEEPSLDPARTAEENTRAFAAGRKQGFEEGRALERESHRAASQAEEDRRKQEYAKLAADFVAASERYLGAIEREVVKLALAVAARILRREAQMDPLLLAGAVRVALGQLAANSEVRLRVPVAHANLWTEAMALVPRRGVKPVVVADEKMRLGDCLIEGQAGTVDLGVRSQLGEIERGFFDRAGAGAPKAEGVEEAAMSEVES